MNDQQANELRLNAMEAMRLGDDISEEEIDELIRDAIAFRQKHYDNLDELICWGCHRPMEKKPFVFVADEPIIWICDECAKKGKYNMSMNMKVKGRLKS